MTPDFPYIDWRQAFWHLGRGLADAAYYAVGRRRVPFGGNFVDWSKVATISGRPARG